MTDMTKDEVRALAEEIGQQIGQTLGQQTASQIAQQVGESVSQAISKVLQSQTQTTGATMVAGREELGDIGGTERLEKDQMNNSEMLFANEKRTYDEYQHESLESIKRNRSYVDKILSDAHGYDMDARNIANQSLQNAVETANMVGKQAVRHSDIAIDRQWNVDEQAGFVAKILNSIQDPATSAAMAVAIAEAMLGKKTTD